eukprot:364490-Chlamydomonas_euryale.AAC.7
MARAGRLYGGDFIARVDSVGSVDTGAGSVVAADGGRGRCRGRGCSNMAAAVADTLASPDTLDGSGFGALDNGSDDDKDQSVSGELQLAMTSNSHERIVQPLMRLVQRDSYCHACASCAYVSTMGSVDDLEVYLTGFAGAVGGRRAA